MPAWRTLYFANTHKHFNTALSTIVDIYLYQGHALVLCTLYGQRYGAKVLQKLNKHIFIEGELI